MSSRTTIRLNVSLEGDKPPSEFRIFTAGKVETSKGTFTFDAAAAKSVLAHYADQGNELMVDYDHASLGLAIDPALAGKAAGWFNLELRGGELWAVNVRWTEPAALALARKEWRYMSPAFATDEDGRIVELINVALTNIPATKRLQPLMAAKHGEMRMANDDADMAARALKRARLRNLLGLAEDATDEQVAEAVSDMDASALIAVLEAAAEALDEIADETPSEEEPEMMTESEPPGDEEEQSGARAGLAALGREVMLLTGRSSPSAAKEDLRAMHASHMALAKEREQLARAQAQFESEERKRLHSELVTEACVAPGLLFDFAPGKNGKLTRTPKAFLGRMSIKELRDFVADAKKSLPEGSRKKLRPPTAQSGQDFETDHGAYTVSASEHALCKRKNLDPAKYAATRAAILARNVAQEI